MNPRRHVIASLVEKALTLDANAEVRSLGEIAE